TTLVDPPFDNARVGYLVSREGAILRPSAGGDGQAIAGGITFPVLATESDGFRILDVCGREGWLASTDVDQGMVPTDRVAGLDQAVLVIDPGHGYPDLGVVGPTRLYESVVNLDISARLAELLRAPRDVNWDNGAITAGTTYPAVAAAILTRGPDGPA